MENISDNYIEEAIETLADSIGIKDNVDNQKIISLIRQRKVKEGIKEIAKCLGLPIEINLSYVPKGYHPGTTNNFHSTYLVKTDWRGRGSEGITAQVSIPGYLPMYGTSELNDFPISVRVSENCANSPATFIAIMAHELSHIVLHSLWHKEKDNEIYTDITAMMLGFSNIIKSGRKVIKTNTLTDYGFFSNTTTTTVETTTYGYLSDNNFNFAFNKIALESTQISVQSPTSSISSILCATISSARATLPKVGLSMIQVFFGRTDCISEAISCPKVPVMQCSTGRYFPSWVFRYSFGCVSRVQ